MQKCITQAKHELNLGNDNGKITLFAVNNYTGHVVHLPDFTPLVEHYLQASAIQEQLLTEKNICSSQIERFPAQFRNKDCPAALPILTQLESITQMANNLGNVKNSHLNALCRAADQELAKRDGHGLPESTVQRKASTATIV